MPFFDEQFQCEMCGVGLTPTSSLAHPRPDYCLFCGSRRLRQRPLSENFIRPDQGVLHRIAPDAIDRAAEKAVAWMHKQNRINRERVQETGIQALYLPYWSFDMVVDPDGSGSDKPYARHEWLLAVDAVPVKQAVEGLKAPEGIWQPVDAHTFSDAPMLVPQIRYEAALRSLLGDVQTNLDAQGLPARRSSGIIGEVGVITLLKLVPVWWLTVLEPQRLHVVIVHGTTGKVHVSKPRLR